MQRAQVGSRVVAEKPFLNRVGIIFFKAIKLLTMKKLSFLFALALVTLTSNFALANVPPVEDGKNQHLIQKLVDNFDAAVNKTLNNEPNKVKADTTIKIKGKGGMDANAGRICPETASTECATITIKGLAVKLTDGVRGVLNYSGKDFDVKIYELGTIRNSKVDGKNVTYELNR